MDTTEVEKLALLLTVSESQLKMKLLLAAGCLLFRSKVQGRVQEEAEGLLGEDPGSKKSSQCPERWRHPHESRKPMRITLESVATALSMEQSFILM